MQPSVQGLPRMCHPSDPCKPYPHAPIRPTHPGHPSCPFCSQHPTSSLTLFLRADFNNHTIPYLMMVQCAGGTRGRYL